MDGLLKVLKLAMGIDVVMIPYLWAGVASGIENDTLNGVQALLIITIGTSLAYLLLRVLAEASERIMNR